MFYPKALESKSRHKQLNWKIMRFFFNKTPKPPKQTQPNPLKTAIEGFLITF